MVFKKGIKTLTKNKPEIGSFFLFRFLFLVCFVCLQQKAFSQVYPPIIIHSDIDRFWIAFDQLQNAKSSQDTLDILQQLYFDKGSVGLKKFAKAKDINSQSLALQIRKAPEFWKSIRPNTYLVKNYNDEISDQIELYRETLRRFKNPYICFAIGALGAGGTVYDGWLLIGAEMVTTDSLTNIFQLTDWHRAVLPKSNKILEFTAHELVHTQQRFGLGYLLSYFRNKLLTMTIVEGAADFVSEKITGLNINESIYPYGYENEKELWQAFSSEMYGNDISNWLYNGNKSKERPADLGYFIGYRICEAYYNQAENKEKALNKIVKTNNYRRLLKKSGYAGGV
ncbi:DUF2268 domain-containing putative Zn-dependent protease [Mongoliibacter ruber]|uniref:Putative Zn-dependent protease DUF2268 n=1 Tax=Mongoliibacter ruber TaxID=1750599 RepID=A0A2T0WF53_9BACT|nr:DUF2268 domain-containing putative Zn-dependent protease [Mongoliibacter ruber]PRY85154.1 putative Zn-dependent protease DUF2268 [Mongoliibacter ruber]